MPRTTGTTGNKRTTSTTRPRRKTAVPARGTSAVPAQRRSEIEELGLRVEELVVADHEAQDARLFHALEWSAD